MIRADLHLHTQVSDGIDSAETVIKKCVKSGLDVIAITDHDTKPDAAYLKSLAKKYHIKLLVGIECGSKDPVSGKRAHILGYGVEDYRQLMALLDPVLERRNAHSLVLIERLNKMGYELTEEEVRSHITGRVIYRQHVIYALYKKGLIPEMWGVWYQNMFRGNGALAISNWYPQPQEIVAAITAGGGAAVLAHPGQQQNFSLIPGLAAAGLAGIEWLHPSNSCEDQKRIEAYSRKYGLFLTGGSDYHGILSNSGGQIGAYSMSYEKVPDALVKR